MESELPDHEQAANFRSGLGLALSLSGNGQTRYPACGEDFSLLHARPNVKAVSALRHLASYVDGTPEHGLLLQNTEEDKCIFDVWRDELICDEINAPQEKSEAKFNLDAFTSSGVVFLNGSMILSIC